MQAVAGEILFAGKCRGASLDKRAYSLFGVLATKAAGRKYVEAGEASAIHAIDDIRAKVMNSQDAEEGIRSFIERRAAVFTGN